MQKFGFGIRNKHPGSSSLIFRIMPVVFSYSTVSPLNVPNGRIRFRLQGKPALGTLPNKSRL
jgi:hypothetical protein